MSEKVLKIVPAPEARISPEAKADTSSKTSLLERLGRKRLRMILLVGLPVLAVMIGLDIHLSGGRYISTDNAYIGAQKVLITHDISGKITHAAIREGQHVNPGDELFTLDREPFALAPQRAKATLDSARSDFDKLKANLKSLGTLVELAKRNVELKQHDVDRQAKLVSSRAGSQADLDAAQVAVVSAQLQAEYAVQQRKRWQ
jgi:membrane fusion protein (multidrug efflux system)